MAESEVSVRFTSKEEAQLWQSFVKLTSGLNKVKDGADKTRKATDDVAASLKRFAANEIKLSTTPLEQFVAKTGQLDAALKANLLTQQQHAAASARAAAQWRESWKAGDVKITAPAAVQAEGPSDELRRFSERIKQIQTTPLERVTAEIKKIDAAMKAKLLTEQQHAAAVKRAQDEYQAELDQTAKKLKTTQQASGEAARGSGASWTRMLGAVGISMASAAALVHKVFAGIREDADRSSQAVQASFLEVGQLGQIGGAAETRERLKIADEYFASGATSSVGEARKTVLALSNVGGLGDAKLFAALQKTGLSLDPAMFADRAARLQSTLGEGEAGSFPQMMARAFVAAEPVNTQPADLIAAAAKSGQSAATLGIKSPELYATTAAMIKAKGLDEGGSRLASFLSKLTTLEGVSGTGILDRVASIQSKGMSPAELKKFLGDETSVEAVGIIGRAAPAIAGRSKQIEAATPAILTQKISEQMANPEVFAGVQAAQERNRLALQEREAGIGALSVDAIRDRALRGIKQDGSRLGLGNVLGETGREIDAKVAGLAIGGIRQIPGADRAIQGGGSNSFMATASAMGMVPFAAQILQRLDDVSRELKGASGAIDNAARQMNGGARGTARPPRQDWINAARRDQAVEAQ